MSSLSPLKYLEQGSCFQLGRHNGKEDRGILGARGKDAHCCKYMLERIFQNCNVGANTLDEVDESTLISQPKGENIGVVVLIFCDLTSLFTSICRQ